ncbi:MAG: SDR family NAD(P)-dependent oxidoreductase [archaeon]
MVTGGAGFIGSYIVDKLIEEGHEVRILDNLDEQVHKGIKPDYLNKKAEFIKGDIRDRKTVKKALEDIEMVFHKAAAVGIGQSMYEIERYVDVNSRGTALLMDVIVNERNDVKKIILASSMTSYGEGLYECSFCGQVEPELRTQENIKIGKWEPDCPKCGKEIRAIPTGEEKTQKPNSIYGITKKNQEDIVLKTGKTYGIPAVSLRYFTVFGPRQALHNPYAGVIAVFMSRIKNNNPPTVYENGLQTRDFISVHDAVEANLLAIKSNSANYEAFNIGSGKAIPIKEAAETIAELYNSKIKPEIKNKFRKGDVRHCFADISKAKNKLNWQPKVSFKQGIREIIQWSKTIEAKDLFEKASRELEEKGIV